MKDIKNKKTVVLTDLNNNYWEGIDISNIQKRIIDINKKINNVGVMYGELKTPEILDCSINKFDISLTNVAFSITNVFLKNNKIYGDIKFLSNKYGIEAESLFKLKQHKFQMRAAGIKSINKFKIKQIFTWDIYKK